MVRRVKERVEEFNAYFGELEKQGIPYGLSDLHRKAIELDLPIPLFDGMKILKWAKSK